LRSLGRVHASASDALAAESDRDGVRYRDPGEGAILKNPFRCRGCEAKDEELKFLRGQFASMRSVVKDAVSVEPSRPLAARPSIASEPEEPMYPPIREELLRRGWTPPSGNPRQSVATWGREPVEERDEVEEREALHSPERES